MSMKPDEKVAVIRAAERGVALEFRARPDDGSGDPAFARAINCYGTMWRPTSDDFYGKTSHDFNFDHYDFRIKPEPPKPREWWLAVDSHGDVLKVCDRQTDNPGFIPRIHVREVLP